MWAVNETYVTWRDGQGDLSFCFKYCNEKLAEWSRKRPPIDGVFGGAFQGIAVSE